VINFIFIIDCDCSVRSSKIHENVAEALVSILDPGAEEESPSGEVIEGPMYDNDSVEEKESPLILQLYREEIIRQLFVFILDSVS